MDCEAEWPAKADPGGKGHGGVAGKAVSSRIFRIRLSLREHSVVAKLIFFCLCLAAGAILGVVTTFNAVGYLRSTETGFRISTSIASTEVLSHDVPSNSTGEESQPPLLATNFTTSDAPALEEAEPAEKLEPRSGLNSTKDEASFKDKEELPSSNSLSELALMPNRVDLSTLSDVFHDMSDAELQWRASASVRRPRPASVSPKLAFLFLTRGPLPLAPLWERYFAGHGPLFNVYVHAHPRFRPSFPPQSAFYRRNIPSKEVSWGRFSVFAAERRLLANALLDAANERFVLLSESCIPIAPLPVAYRYFMHSEHSFVEAYVDMGRGGMGRYTRIKRREKLRPEINPDQWRKGSQWFEMSRELAAVVVADRTYYPKYENILCMKDCVCYVDEHYLATVLTILAPDRIANRTAHYIDFHRSTAHPYQWEPGVVTERTLKRITAESWCSYNGKLTQTCHMFARKFSPATIAPLLLLANASFGIP